jgi:hypothetical protein
MSKVRIQRVFLLAACVTAFGFAARPALAQTGLQYYAVTPCRAVDTRSGFGGIIQASVFRGFTMQGVCGVPVGAKAVSVNLTIVGPSQTGFFSLWPFGGPFPTVASINFDTGEPAIANGAIVPLATGSPDLYGGYGTGNGQGTTHAILDVTGYFQ